MKKKIIIVGAGTSGIAAALFLDTKKYDVCVVEGMASPGRKFLLAGKTGLNLSHSGDVHAFARHYYKHSSIFEKLIGRYDLFEFMQFLNHLGIETYKGSSGKYFPLEHISTHEVLNQLLHACNNKGISFLFNSMLRDFSEKRILLDNGDEHYFDYLILALGGASWPETGSTGEWTKIFNSKDITVNDFEPANCGVHVDIPKEYFELYEGESLKNLQLRIKDFAAGGDVIITRRGLQGKPVYELIPYIRHEIPENGYASLVLNFKPGMPLKRVKSRLGKLRGRRPLTYRLKNNLKLSDASVKLVKYGLTKEQFLNEDDLSEILLSFKLKIIGLDDISRSISVAGGVDFSEIESNFSLKKYPNVYTTGEMVDWEACTGGYLIHGCFAISKLIADQINEDAN